MPLSRVVQQLHAHRVYTDDDLIRRFGVDGEPVVAITYLRRVVQSDGTEINKTHVWAPDTVTDPDAHWADHGNKTFVGNKDVSWPQAIAWAQATYGITEWAPSPFGARTWLPKALVRRVRLWAREAAKGLRAV